MFVYNGNVETRLLNISSVHPNRKEVIEQSHKKSTTDWIIIEKVLNNGEFITIAYENHKYYMKRLVDRIENCIPT